MDQAQAFSFSISGSQGTLQVITGVNKGDRCNSGGGHRGLSPLLMQLCRTLGTTQDSGPISDGPLPSLKNHSCTPQMHDLVGVREHSS